MDEDNDVPRGKLQLKFVVDLINWLVDFLWLRFGNRFDSKETR